MKQTPGIAYSVNYNVMQDLKFLWKSIQKLLSCDVMYMLPKDGIHSSKMLKDIHPPDYIASHPKNYKHD